MSNRPQLWFSVRSIALEGSNEPYGFSWLVETSSTCCSLETSVVDVLFFCLWIDDDQWFLDPSPYWVIDWLNYHLLEGATCLRFSSRNNDRADFDASLFFFFFLLFLSMQVLCLQKLSFESQCPGMSVPGFMQIRRHAETPALLHVFRVRQLLWNISRPQISWCHWSWNF